MVTIHDNVILVGVARVSDSGQVYRRDKDEWEILSIGTVNRNGRVYPREKDGLSLLPIGFVSQDGMVYSGASEPQIGGAVGCVRGGKIYRLMSHDEFELGWYAIPERNVVFVGGAALLMGFFDRPTGACPRCGSVAATSSGDSTWHARRAGIPSCLAAPKKNTQLNMTLVT